MTIFRNSIFIFFKRIEKGDYSRALNSTFAIYGLLIYFNIDSLRVVIEIFFGINKLNILNGTINIFEAILSFGFSHLFTFKSDLRSITSVSNKHKVLTICYIIITCVSSIIASNMIRNIY
ncbi:hypothetical protein HNP25_002050 [Arcicella rosea]|uniref:Uncharacterized protein n=1 Tax=Arcicella rosea TaxID=502909 RepID=A0A841EMH2_9BACT|nr:hypothetical protein [Arcicella rosea]